MQIKKFAVVAMTTLLAVTSINASFSSVNAQSTTKTTQETTTHPKWVCSIQAVYLYQHPNFKTSQRISLIKSQDRQKYPVFKVIKTAKDQNNHLRYQVRILTGEHKNQVGYVTANNNFVQPLYYTSNQIREVQVIAPKIKIYRDATFKQPVKTVTQGHNVKVVGITKNDHGRFRLTLANHQYITANQKFVLDLKDANNQNM
ncbi:DUF5776 domain-containing protein [Lactobacillaceae bacterium Melli_B3]